MINKDRLIRLTRQLIRIDSQNPPGNERRIGCFLKNYFEHLGLKVQTYEFAASRTNVIVTLGGKKKAGSLLITPHSDTVPAGKSWTIDPFGGTMRKNRIYGLGSTDCKGNLAVSMEVIRSLVEQETPLGYNLIFAATADEESGSALGLKPLLEKRILRPDAALVLDADDFNIVVAQKGLIHLKVKISGRKAHGAYPWLGVNAIDAALQAIKKIQAYKFSRTRDPFLKGPTINIGTIKGGDKVNVVADWCEFELDIRFLPGDSAKMILQGVRNILKDSVRNFSRRSGIPLGAGKVEIEGVQQPFSIAAGHKLVECLAQAMRFLKIKPVLRGSEGATVISFFQEKKIPSLATGFGVGTCAHMADEYARIDNLYKGALLLENFLKNYGG